MKTILTSGTADALHRKTQEKTGFWGTKGAGILIVCASTRRVLLNLRSAQVEEPLTWGLWGGAVDPKEDIREAAIRELKEEAGYKGKLTLSPLHLFKSGSFEFHNFLGIVPKEFKPKLDKENTSAEWFLYRHFPSPLHFGIRSILQTPAARDIFLRAIRE